MRGNLPVPKGWQGTLLERNQCIWPCRRIRALGRLRRCTACHIVSTMDRAARLAPLPAHYPMARPSPNCIAWTYGLQRGSRRILRQAPGVRTALRGMPRPDAGERVRTSVAKVREVEFRPGLGDVKSLARTLFPSGEFLQ